MHSKWDDNPSSELAFCPICMLFKVGNLTEAPDNKAFLIKSSYTPVYIGLVN